MGRRLSKNTLILLISNGGSAVLSFLIAVFIGRYYGEDGLGIYAGVLAWIFPLSFIVEFGFGTMITRDIAQQPDLAPDYLKLTWRFRWIVGTLLIALISIVSYLTTSDWLYILISSPLVIILPAYSAYTAIFRSHQRMFPIACLNLGMLIIQVTLIGIALVTSAHIVWLFIINTLTSFGQLLGAIWTYRQYFYQKPKHTTDLRLFDLIRQSRSFAIAGILSAVQARFSILWLETVSTATVVGLFVASLRFIDGARMIPNALFGAVYPALSSLAGNTAKLNRLFRRIILALTSYGLVVAGMLWIFADEILVLTFGEDFIDGQSALIIMGLMLIPFVLRSGWILYWYAIGRERAVNRILFINLISLIGLPTLVWLTGLYRNALEIIAHTMLYTEVITVILMLLGDIILWRPDTTSSTS